MSQTYLPDAGRRMEGLLGEFEQYLRGERGLAPTTVVNYLNQVRPFTGWLLRQGAEDLVAVNAVEVHRFITWRAEACAPGSIKVAGTALRAWLGWMFTSGHAEVDLSQAVGPVHYPARTRLPKGFTPAEVAALRAVDCSARDRAVVTVFVRLALRSHEVAAMRLDDVCWRAATLRVTGKGQDVQPMPLPADVGAALADYLRVRPTGVGCREVFLTATPPHRSMHASGVSSIVIRAARRAGIAGPLGAHRLRHSAATAVLAAGGTLTEAGQLLRHRSVEATLTYAAVDYAALQQMARPWPMSPQRGAVL